MRTDLLAMLHPHFTPDITLGHLLQAGVVIVAGGGGVLGAYLSLRADIDTQRTESASRSPVTRRASAWSSASSTSALVRVASSARRCAPPSSA